MYANSLLLLICLWFALVTCDVTKTPSLPQKKKIRRKNVGNGNKISIIYSLSQKPINRIAGYGKLYLTIVYFSLLVKRTYFTQTTSSRPSTAINKIEPDSDDPDEDGRANISRAWLCPVRSHVDDFRSYRNLPRLHGWQTANYERIPTWKPEHEDLPDCDFVVGFVLVCHHAARRAERDLHLWRTIHRPSFVLFWLDRDGRDNLCANVPSTATDQCTRSKWDVYYKVETIVSLFFVRELLRLSLFLNVALRFQGDV